MTDTVTRGDTLHDRAVEQIKTLLLRRGMSARDLAAKIGVKQAYISRRMTGEVPLNLDEIEAIATALGVDVLDLLREPQPLPPLEPIQPRLIVRGGARRRYSDNARQPKGGTGFATNQSPVAARPYQRQVSPGRTVNTPPATITTRPQVITTATAGV